MIGIIVELILSWLLLWLMVKKDLSALGLKPGRDRIRNLLAGLLLATVSCTGYHLMTTALADNSWTLNTALTLQALLARTWWTLKSVIFEELIFRGALLYIAIEKWGPRIACISSAACFGVYHWFSFGSFGNPFQMAIIFFMTGLFGFALAWAFAKSSSLYLPTGLHLGWNLVNIVVFSNGPLGDQLFIKANTNHVEGLLSLFVFLFQVVALPVLALVYIRYFMKKRVT